MTNKKGISLIVLIITIIVIIILAGAVILSLNNTNVIENANTAVEKNNLDVANSALTLFLGNEMVERRDLVTVVLNPSQEDKTTTYTSEQNLTLKESSKPGTYSKTFAEAGLDSFSSLTFDERGKIVKAEQVKAK